MKVEPIHTGPVVGQPVRFFASPAATPDLPWHAADDLWRAIGMPPDVRAAFLRDMQALWGGAVATAATSTGIVCIVPTFVGVSFISAAIDIDRVTNEAAHDFENESVHAMVALMDGLGAVDRIHLSLRMHAGAVQHQVSFKMKEGRL